ncbi:MAG: spore coat protein [Eubacteriales bacterium]|nr:spore coat protein [Eubacteriales bacterium]
MMPLTPKEASLLKDLRTQEQLCVEKYNKYAAQACDGQLQTLFTQIAQKEATHQQTIEGLEQGVLPSMGGAEAPVNTGFTRSCCIPEQKKQDQYLCQDALATEKHVSSAYDTCIFEFRDSAVRDALNHIQKEEQQHGEYIYQYMAQNGMY